MNLKSLHKSKTPFPTFSDKPFSLKRAYDAKINLSFIGNFDLPYPDRLQQYLFKHASKLADSHYASCRHGTGVDASSGSYIDRITSFEPNRPRLNKPILDEHSGQLI